MRKYLLIGDSLSDGEKTPGGRLASFLEAAGVADIQNISKGGWSAATFLSKGFDTSKYQADGAIVFLGTNDVANKIVTDAKRGNGDKYFELLVKLARACKTAYGKLKIIGPPRFFSVPKYPTMEAVASELRALLQKEFGADFLDAGPLTPAAGRGGDGIHFGSGAGPFAENLFSALTGKRAPQPSPQKTGGTKSKVSDKVTRWAPLWIKGFASYDPAGKWVAREFLPTLATSLAFFHHESGGNPNATSYRVNKTTGVKEPLARGLGQFIAGTAKMYGLTDPYIPEQAILGQMRFVGALIKRWKERSRDEEQLQRLIAGSYYAGPGSQEKTYPAYNPGKKSSTYPSGEIEAYMDKHWALYQHYHSWVAANYPAEARLLKPTKTIWSDMGEAFSNALLD